MEIPKLSTGEPSTLGTYLKYAKCMGPKAEALIRKWIEKDSNGENGIVTAPESQMQILLFSLAGDVEKKLSKNAGKERQVQKRPKLELVRLNPMSLWISDREKERKNS